MAIIEFVDRKKVIKNTKSADAKKLKQQYSEINNNIKAFKSTSNSLSFKYG